MEEPEMEPWDRPTVEREIAAFRADGDLVDLPEAEIRRQFGEPDLVMPGLRQDTSSGQLVFQADKDLRYFRLLPHTCVNVSILDGRVRHVGYWAKWKTCPPEKRAALGSEYAPE